MKKISPWLDTVPDKLRFAPLTKDATADVAVIGAGIVGILTAWQMARAGKKVVVLEKNHVGTGDTGLTTGFLTRVPDTSTAGLKDKYGSEFVRGLYGAASEAQQFIFSVIKDCKIACDFTGCDSFFCAYTAEDEVIDHEWPAMREADTRAELARGEKMVATGGALNSEAEKLTAKTPFKIAVKFPGEGKFNSRKFLFGLLEKSRALPLTVCEETEVVDVVADNVSHEVKITARAPNASSTVTAKQVIVATGLPHESFPELRELVTPRLTYVIGARYETAAPLPDDLYFDTFEPYFYYRKIDGRTIILGGCDKDANAPQIEDPVAKLRAFLNARLPGKHEVVYAWSGSLFHTPDGLPYAFAHPHYGGKVLVATGFGGNGLVCGALASQTLCALALGKESASAELLSTERTRTKIEKPKPRPAGRATGKPSAQTFVKVAKFKDLAPGRPICATASGRRLLLTRHDNKVYAISNTCTHAGGSLCEGVLDGKIITCPLHNARFDVTTGAVVALPASRPVETYATRVVGDDVEVELPAEGSVAGEAQAGGITGASGRRKFKTLPGLALFSFCALLFWLAEFAYQYYRLIPGELGGSLVRSFALAGATLFGAALFSSALFKWVPRWSIHWRLRRYLGVGGFVFTTFHVLSVTKFLFQWQITGAFYSWNPFVNPIIFGAVAFPIFFALAATSTDWAVAKLGGRRWKNLHRLVYFGYLAAIFHFILINPELLKNAAGYVLLTITALALFGELYWFIMTVKNKLLSLGTAVGLVVILLYIGLGYKAYRTREPKTQIPTPVTEPAANANPSSEYNPKLIETRPDEAEAVKAMKSSMKTNPGTAPTAPVVADQLFRASASRSGTFQNLNYMTAGSVTFEKKDGDYFVVFGSDFKTPNGPDLVVYLTKNSGATTREDITAGIKLGELKSTAGKQVYAVPAGYKTEDYNSVSIHCRAFNVPWSYAPLSPSS